MRRRRLRARSASSGWVGSADQSCSSVSRSSTACTAAVARARAVPCRSRPRGPARRRAAAGRRGRAGCGRQPAGAAPPATPGRRSSIAIVVPAGTTRPAPPSRIVTPPRPTTSAVPASRSRISAVCSSTPRTYAPCGSSRLQDRQAPRAQVAEAGVVRCRPRRCRSAAPPRPAGRWRRRAAPGPAPTTAAARPCRSRRPAPWRRRPRPPRRWRTPRTRPSPAARSSVGTSAVPLHTPSA